MASVLELALLSNSVYSPRDTSKVPNGWNNAKPLTTDKPGFFAARYDSKNNKEIVYAIRGTDDIQRDILVDDLGIGLGMIPSQWAICTNNFEDFIKKTTQEKRVFITGHSLGGALAQLLANKYPDFMTATFNAPGVAQLILNGRSKPKNILNVRANNDPVSKKGIHFGPIAMIHVPAISGRDISVCAGGVALTLLTGGTGVAAMETCAASALGSNGLYHHSIETMCAALSHHKEFATPFTKV